MQQTSNGLRHNIWQVHSTGAYHCHKGSQNDVLLYNAESLKGHLCGLIVSPQTSSTEADQT